MATRKSKAAAPEVVTAPCAFCGKDHDYTRSFVPGSGARYCSRGCAMAGEGEYFAPHGLSCAACGQDIQGEPYHWLDGETAVCSAECLAKEA